MQIQVESSYNCAASEQFVFQELGPPRAVRSIKVVERGRETVCDVAAVQKGGEFTDAFAVKIADSGAGYAYLIYGGEWGIRLRPANYASEQWDLANPHQSGEPFKIYGEEEDIIY